MTLNVWCVPLSLCPVHSCHVVLWACLPSCSKLPIDSVCHGLALGPQRVAFVCSQPCPVSICYWDGLQCCHHPNQNKWTFVCCLCWISVSMFLKSKEKNGYRLSCCTFAEDTPKQVKNRVIVNKHEAVESVRNSLYFHSYIPIISWHDGFFFKYGISPNCSMLLNMGERLLPLPTTVSA